MTVGLKTDPLVMDEIIRDLSAGGLSLRKIAAKHGIPVSTIADIGRRCGAKKDLIEEREWSESNGEATLDFKTPEMVRTEADAIRVGQVDLARWRVKRWTLKTYQVATKHKLADKTHETRVTQLYAVKLDLESILPKPYLDASEALWQRLEERSPRFDVEPLIASQGASLLCELDLCDIHFGKLCWAPETGQNYDLRIAERVFKRAIEDLLAKLRGQVVSRFVVPLGNDLFHVDSLMRMTTAGTPQDSDCRYAKMIEIGEASVLAGIDRLQGIAPVDVVYVPGNHDRLASYHLCRTASAWFRHSPRVSVDLSPSVRKYRRYGCNLFGYTHGDKVVDSGIRSLPAMMAVEAPQDWGQTTCREWKLGHRHTSRRFETRSSDEFQGVQVRWLSSLSGTDAWHFEQGFIGNRRAAEAYLYDMESGYSGHIVAIARTS